MHTNSHLPEGNVYYVFFDSTGKGWICTENGVCILDADKLVIRANVFPKGFPASEKMMAIYEDASHTLYFIPYKTNLFTSDISMKCFRYCIGWERNHDYHRRSGRLDVDRD